MSKGNIILGDSSGKLGDIVLYRRDGFQIARLRIRHPRNPQTTRQMVQRVFYATAMSAYSLLKEICSGTFEGSQGRAKNYQAFIAANVHQWNRMLNDYAEGWENMISFCKRYDKKTPINAYVVSNGSLPPINVILRNGGVIIQAWASRPTSMTYQEACDAIGVNKGDVLTIIGLNVDGQNGEVERVEVGKIVMMPRDGDMSKQFIDAATNKINDPHPMTTNNFSISITSQGGVIKLSFPVYWGAIVLEHDDGHMKRFSRNEILIRHLPSAPTKLGDAVKSWWQTPAKGKYLNQAERQLIIN